MSFILRTSGARIEEKFQVWRKKYFSTLLLLLLFDTKAEIKWEKSILREAWALGNINEILNCNTDTKEQWFNTLLRKINYKGKSSSNFSTLLWRIQHLDFQLDFFQRVRWSQTTEGFSNMTIHLSKALGNANVNSHILMTICGDVHLLLLLWGINFTYFIGLDD